MFSDERPEITAADVAESLGVARSTAYRYLQSLGRSGFLTETGRGGFRLGSRILELARIARRGHGLSDICVPEMRKLASEFHQTVLLTKRMGDVVVCLEREESTEQHVRLSYERGTVLTLNAGASALVLLAWMPDGRVRELMAEARLPRYNGNTLCDPDAIVARLGEIRQRGYAVSNAEVDSIVMGIAAPIFHRDDEVLAAVSVVMISSLVSAAQVGEIKDRLAAVAAGLSAEVRLLDQ